MQSSPFQHEPVMPLSHLTSVEAQTDGAGLLQDGGHTDPSGMQKSPFQQLPVMPMSQTTSVLEQLAGG